MTETETQTREGSTEASETQTQTTLDRETETKAEAFRSLVSGLKTKVRRPGGRVWAYVGSILGGLVSVSANVRHSFIAPDGKPADWSPEVMQVGFSILGPVFLFIGLEVLTRVSWPKGFLSWAVRLGGILPVTVVSAFVSYLHMAGLMAYWSEHKFVQYSLPIAVDGLMVMCSVAVYITGRAYAKRKEEAGPVQVQVSTKKQVRAETRAPRPVPETQTQVARPVPETRKAVSVSAAAVSTPTVSMTIPTETGTAHTQTETQGAEVSSLPARSLSRAEQIEAIKAAVPEWRELGGEVPNKEITRATGVTGKQTLTNLRKILREEAA